MDENTSKRPAAPGCRWLTLRDWPEDLHAAIKIRAIQERLTIREILIKAAKQYLNTIGRDE